MEVSCFLEPVLRYLKASTRLQLSHRCPSISFLEKSTTLHIETLEISNSQVWIDNSLHYKVEVLEDHLTPRRYDLDEHCALDLEMRVERKPNEILMDTRSEAMVHQLLDFEQSEIGIEQRRVANLPNEEERVRDRAALERRMMIHQMKALQMISHVTKVPPLVISKEHIDHHIRFSIKKHAGRLVSHTSILHEELLIYDRMLKLHDAQFYVLENLFAGRSRMNVKTFKIWSNGILRVPASLSMKVHKLKFSHGTCEMLRPLLEPFSLPLKCLETYKVPDCIDPIVEGAEELVLSNEHKLDTLSNLKVSVQLFCTSPVDLAAKVIEKWLEVGKQIGTEFTLKTFGFTMTKDLIEHVKRRFEERILKEEESNGDLTSVTLAMRDSADLLITREMNQNIEVLKLRVLQSNGEKRK